MKTSRATLYDSFFQQVLREDLLGRASLHDLVLEAMCTQASHQLSLRSLRSDWKPPLAAVRNRLLHFALPQIVTACAARRCLPPLMRFRSAGNIFLALPATHEFGFMPSGRTAHRTGNETHHLVNWHDSYYCVSADSFRPTLFFCEPPALPQNCGFPFRKVFGPNGPHAPQSTAVLSLRQVQLHLQSFGSLTSSSDPKRPWTCQFGLGFSRTADAARVQANTELLSDKTEPVLWLNKRTERLAHVIANHKDAMVGSSAECADYAPKRGRVATLRGPRNFHLQSRSHCRRSAPELQKPCRVGLLLRNAFPALDDHLVEGCEPLLYWRLDWSTPTSADGKDPAKLETCDVIAGATVWAKGAHPT